jgi:hypothetical protein
MRKIILLSLVCLVLFSSFVFGVFLTDAELFFDPYSLPRAVYPSQHLENLNVHNQVVFGQDVPDIMSAQILPVLNAGEYPDGYFFTQADYMVMPNVDYFADLTGGILTVTFEREGIYHIRMPRGGSDETWVVFVQTYRGADANETSTTKDAGIPAADLFIISDDSEDSGYADSCEDVLDAEGKTTERCGSRQAAINAIKKLSAPPKKHVEICGHGVPGAISIGSGTDLNADDDVLDGDTAASFQEEVDDYIDELTFLGCNVGEGEDGADFLQTLADSIGTVRAWDSRVYISVDINDSNAVTGGTFLVPVDANYITATPKAEEDFEDIVDQAQMDSVWMPQGSAQCFLVTDPTLARTGEKAMALEYDFSQPPHFAEVSHCYEMPTNWLEQKTAALSFWTSDLGEKSIFVTVQDFAGMTAAVFAGEPYKSGRPGDLYRYNYTIPYECFMDMGVDLAAIQCIGIHFEPGSEPFEQGVVYLDDIELHTPQCKTIIPADLNGDCVVNWLDFAKMCDYWLESGMVPEMF